MTILLTGMTSSGKDKVKNILTKMFNHKPIVSHTTRPKRINEVNHKDYHFVTELEFNDIMMLETRSYDTIFEGKAQTWIYGTSLKELDKKGDKVCIKDLEGAIKLKEHIKDSIIIYIEVPEEIRKQRAIERGSFCELEYNRRLEQDSKDFDEELIEKHCEYFIYNYKDEEYLLEQIKDLVSFIKFQKDKINEN